MYNNRANFPKKSLCKGRGNKTILELGCRGMTVVVVDDEPIVRKDICLILEKNGYEVVAQASDGLEAISCCREHRPSAVIMDMRMPLMDGACAAEIIVKEDLCSCILMLTAYSDRESVTKAKLAGVVHYLVKPIRAKTLIPALEIALEVSKTMTTMRRSVAEMETKLAEQLYVEQAKGILARQRGISETEAYAEIRKMSMERRMRVADLAHLIVDSNSEKKTIDAAKSILIWKLDVTEAEAYKIIKQYGTKNKTSMLEAAHYFMDRYSYE